MRIIFLGLLSLNIAHATLSSCPQGASQSPGCDAANSQFSSLTGGDNLAALMTETSAATTLYTTGGAPPTWDDVQQNAWDILPSAIQGVAVEFDPSVTAKLGQIELPIDLVSGTGSVVVSILADGLPGTVLESWTPDLTTSISMITLTSVLNPTLSQGTNYWLEVTTTGNEEANWYIATTNVRGAGILIDGNWSYSAGSSTPALAILSESAPEPPTSVLTSAGLLAALAAASFRNRRKSPKDRPQARMLWL